MGKEVTSERKSVVVWSGGADSTMLLTERAFASSKANPVIAITVVAYPQIPLVQLQSQAIAQKRYLGWAKKSGFHVSHIRLTVKTVNGLLGDHVTQPLVWVAQIAPFLPEHCRLSFGYIGPDKFWHRRHEADEAIAALQKLAKSTWDVDYPYESSSKADILTALRGWKVPNSCWWSCEDARVVGSACRKCKKCIEVMRGRQEMEKKR